MATRQDFQIARDLIRFVNLVNDLLRGHFFEASGQGDKAVVVEILVEIGRIDPAAMFGGDVFLRSEECGDRWIADFDGTIRVVAVVAETIADR